MQAPGCASALPGGPLAVLVVAVVVSVVGDGSGALNVEPRSSRCKRSGRCPGWYFSSRATLVCLALARPRPMARPPHASAGEASLKSSHVRRATTSSEPARESRIFVVLTVQGDCNFRGHGCSLVRKTAGHGAVAGSAGAVAGPDQRDGSQIRPGLPRRPSAPRRSGRPRPRGRCRARPPAAGPQPVWSKMRAVLPAGPVEVEAVQLVADLDHPAGVDEEVGGVEDAPLGQPGGGPVLTSWASWLLAAPQTMAALSDSTVEPSRAPPSAQGA